jgi:hypothetical protein
MREPCQNRQSAYLSALVCLSIYACAMCAHAQSVSWEILPFPQNSDWPGSKGAPATTNGNVVTLQGQPARTVAVFTPPVSFSFDVILQTLDPTASDGAFWFWFLPRGEAGNLSFTPAVQCNMNYTLGSPTGSLEVDEYPPITILAGGIPFTLTAGTTYHVTFDIAGNGQLTWIVNGQTYVNGTVTIPYPQFQAAIRGWQPTDVWLVSNFTVNTPSTCPTIVGKWSGQPNVADTRKGYSTTPLSMQVTDQTTNGCLIRGYLTQGNVGNSFSNIRFGWNPWFRVPFTGTIAEGSTVLLNVGDDGSGKASAILDMSQTPPVLTKFIYQPGNGNTLTGDLTLQPSSP